MRQKRLRVPEFQQLQRQLTAHLRDPGSPPPAGIEERRLKIYRELFYNNVEGFLANARKRSAAARCDYSLIPTGEPVDAALVKFLSRRSSMAV